MAGKTKQEAVENFLTFVRETLSCVAAQDLTAYQETDNLYKVWFAAPARLVTLSGKYVYLAVTQIFTVVETGDSSLPFKVKTREYSYVFLSSPAFDHHGILAYHWHPNDFSVREPHLHVSLEQHPTCSEMERRIPKVHYPTSRIALEDFVRMLIDYYEIRPRLAKSKWSPILKKNKRAFEQFATWTITHK